MRNTRRQDLILVSAIVATAAVVFFGLRALVGGGTEGRPNQPESSSVVADSPPPTTLPPPPARAIADRLAVPARTGQADAVMIEAQAIEAETGCQIVWAAGAWNDHKGRIGAVQALEQRGLDVAVAHVRVDGPDVGLVVAIGNCG